MVYLTGVDGIVSGNATHTVLADDTNPTGVPLANAQVNPASVPALPLWAVLAAAAAIGAGRGLRRRRG